MGSDDELDYTSGKFAKACRARILARTHPRAHERSHGCPLSDLPFGVSYCPVAASHHTTPRRDDRTVPHRPSPLLLLLLLLLLATHIHDGLTTWPADMKYPVSGIRY